MRSGILQRLYGYACQKKSAQAILTAACSGILISPVCGQEFQGLAPATNAEPTLQATPVEKYERESSTPVVKNYYKELFGSNTSTPEPSRIQTATLAKPVPTEPVSQPTDSPVLLTAQYEYAEDKGSEFQVTPVSGVEGSGLPPWAQNAKASVQPTKPAGIQTTTVSQSQSGGLPTATLQLTPAAETEPATPAASTAPEMPAIPPQQAPTPQISAVVPTNEITSGPQNPNVKVEWQTREGINVGQESQCELIVTNQGTSTAYNVTVDAQFPPQVEVLGSNPSAVTAGTTSWNLGNLKPGVTKQVEVKILPMTRGALNASAEVHFTAATQSSFVVREPMLGVAMSGPSEVLVGDPASQSVTITNPGNGIAKNVVLEAIIPAGLEHPRGERLIMDVGALNPSESRTIRLAVVAVEGGQKKVEVTATADGGLLQKSESVVNVIAPSLQAEIHGPGLRYVGRNATYSLSVANDGTIGTSNVRLMHKIPEGFDYISSTRGASYDAPTRILSWFVGKLEPGKAAEIEVELVANRSGEFTHFVRATSEHGSTTDTQIMTRVEGASAIVMDIVDLDDPVEVGAETAYEIIVKNEGTAAAENVGVSCELPAGIQLIKAEGPAEHVVDQNLILFKPLASIPAGQSQKYRVHVIGTVDGNLRFRARMTSAASPEPLTFEELTRFYGDPQQN